MKTKQLPDNSQGISEAAKILRQGGIVAIPTETVYGLAASAFCSESVEKIFLAKGRPQDNPLIVHISDLEMLNEVVSGVPPVALRLAKHFWPGPLTMVLPKGDRIPKSVCAGLSTVAVRMPSNKTAAAVIKTAGIPLAAPSANRSGSPSPTKADHVKSDLDGKIDAIIMSDDCEVGVESTVITLCTEKPRLLRPGGVTLEMLRAILPDIEVDSAVLSEPEKGAPVASPGMKYKHYSPKTEIILYEGNNFKKFLKDRENCGALCFFEEAENLPVPHVVYGKESEPATLAEGLFSALRAADTLGVPRVYAHAPKKEGVGLAVYNRLIRAAGFNTVTDRKIIGLTGPTGAGKTTVCETAKDLGITVIDCDKVAREEGKNPEMQALLMEEFGDDVIKSGDINRPLLAKRAFETREKTDRLNSIMLPFISKTIKEMLIDGVTVLDAPTLIESGLNSICDSVVSVLAKEDVRRDRIIARDRLEIDAAERRLSAAKDDEFFKSHSQYVIYNDGDVDELKNKTREILTKITEE